VAAIQCLALMRCRGPPSSGHGTPLPRPSATQKPSGPRVVWSGAGWSRARVARRDYADNANKRCRSGFARASPSLLAARSKKAGFPSLDEASPARRRSLFPRLRRRPTAYRASVNGPVQATRGSLRVSSLGYGLGSWGLLNVLFVLSMLYAGHRTALGRPYEHPRTAWPGIFDRDARIAPESRVDRRPRSACDSAARSRHAPPRQTRTGRHRGIVRVRRAPALHPVSRREPGTGAGRQADRGDGALCHRAARQRADHRPGRRSR
jgi:hypothetical protein